MDPDLLLLLCQSKEVLVPTVVILAIIFLIGSVGNICTCVVITRTKSLHTNANYCLLGIACSDLIFLFLGCPLDIYHLICCYISSSEFLCKFWFYIRETYGFASAIAICVFTVERWLAVRHPLRGNVKVRRCCFAFACVSLSALSIVTIWRLNGVSIELETVNETTTHYCIGSPVLSLSFGFTTVAVFTLSYLIPVLLLATLCFQIATTARRTALSAQMGCSRKPIKMITLLVAVVLSFLICWSPHQLTQLNEAFDVVVLTKFQYDVVFNLSACCYYLNGAVNPILYNMFSKKFRQALSHMINGRTATATSETARTTVVTVS